MPKNGIDAFPLHLRPRDFHKIANRERNLASQYLSPKPIQNTCIVLVGLKDPVHRPVLRANVTRALIPGTTRVSVCPRYNAAHVTDLP